MKKGAVPKEAVGLDIATIMTVDSHSNQISHGNVLLVTIVSRLCQNLTGLLI